MVYLDYVTDWCYNVTVLTNSPDQVNVNVLYLVANDSGPMIVETTYSLLYLRYDLTQIV